MKVVEWSLLIVCGFASTASCYVPAEIRRRWEETGYCVQDALKTIEDAADHRPVEDTELFYAVRFIDRSAHKVYSAADKQRLWENAKGSWELRMGYEDSRNDEYFLPYPDFRDFAMAYIMVEENYFGKGIAKNAYFSFVAMGGPALFNAKTRQLYMDYQDFYMNGNCLPDWDLSYFMRGYARNWYGMERNRPPLAFTLIAVTDKILLVRGSKTGGMAFFRRIQEDMRACSYGADWKENIKSFFTWPLRNRRRNGSY